jgi:hypothetical protein
MHRGKKFLPLPGLELQPFARPTHSQSLYRLRYPGLGFVTNIISRDEGGNCTSSVQPGGRGRMRRLAPTLPEAYTLLS